MREPRAFDDRAHGATERASAAPERAGRAPRPTAPERVPLADEAATEALGRRLAATLPPRARVALSGELGAGKSVVARAMLRAWGHVGPVPSPTYAIVESYVLAGRRVAHLDLYRLADPGELHDIGIDDVLAEHDTILVEWPERAVGRLPPFDLSVRLEHDGEGRRAAWLSRDPAEVTDADAAALDKRPGSSML